MVQAMFAPAATWRFSCECTWNADGAELQAALPPGRWRVLAARPLLEPWLSDVVDVAETSIEVTVPLPAARLQRVQLVAADTGDPLAGAEVRPFAEFGDDQAFFAGDARTADAAGMLELPLPEPHAGQRPPSFWATTPTHAGLL